MLLLRGSGGLLRLPDLRTALQRRRGLLERKVGIWVIQVAQIARWCLSGQHIEPEASRCLLCQGKRCTAGLEVRDPPAGGPGLGEVLLA